MTEAMDEHIERAKFLVNAVEGNIRASHAFQADQLCEVWRILAASEARQAEQAATIARLREALERLAVDAFVTCESGQGRYALVFKYPTLQRAQDAHQAWIDRTALEDQHG